MTYNKMTEKFITEVLNAGFSNEGLKLVLANSNTWDYDLPDNLKTQPTVVLDIKDWALDESRVESDGVFVKTAFGDDEYSKLFSFDEILQIITFEGVVIYVKTMQLEEKVELPTAEEVTVEVSKCGIPQELLDSEGVQYSLKKMLEMNSHLDKYKKGL